MMGGGAAFSLNGESRHHIKNGPGGSQWSLSMKSPTAQGFPSMSARESAVNVEWEPLVEVHYHSNDEKRYDRFDSRSGQSHSSKTSFDPQAVQGVFCGFRWTSEEYNRLKSGHP